MPDDETAPDVPPPSWTPPPPASDSTGAVAVTSGGHGGGGHGGGGSGVKVSPVLVIGLLAVALLALSLFIEESPQDGAPGVNLWNEFGVAWSLFALAAVVLTLLPAFATSLNVAEKQAWQLAAIGAGALVFWWVLFVLPAISRNVSFLATLGVAAAGLAVWMGPGNSLKDAADAPSSGQ